MGKRCAYIYRASKKNQNTKIRVIVWKEEGQEMGRQPVRLYCKGTFVNFVQGKHHQNDSKALLALNGVKSREDTSFYMGKRCAYIYRASKKKQNTKIRVIWGKIVRAHGNNGVVRAKFRHNLPSKALGASVRVMLYPSRV